MACQCMLDVLLAVKDGGTAFGPDGSPRAAWWAKVVGWGVLIFEKWCS